MNSDRKRWWLYVLKLEQEKSYVGITSQTPEKRFWEHQNKVRSAYWTIKYPPLEITEAQQLGVMTKKEAEKFENKKVRELIKQLGVNNVRGGDLKDIKDYVIRFGNVYDKESWQVACWSLYIMILLWVFVVDKYFYSFIPGGIR